VLVYLLHGMGVTLKFALLILLDFALALPDLLVDHPYFLPEVRGTLLLHVVQRLALVYVVLWDLG
jgi:hypothetical protein